MSAKRPWRRLPPLNALRSFEAAARHLSVARAAEELRVTPAAVSHQLKSLEAFLGVALFRRTRKGMLLTDEGQACLPGIRDAFDRLVAAIEQIPTATSSGVLTVSVAPSFAAKWLLPRLDRFQADHPEIDVRVSASMQLVDFSEGDVDLAIRYGGGRYAGLEVGRLLAESVFPVCSPALLAAAGGLASPEALRGVTLLHDDSSDNDPTCPDWRMWLKAAGAGHLDATRGPRFNQSSLVVEAAVLGRGVALAKAALAEADLAAGRLVRPFRLVFPVDFAYYVVCPPARAELPKVRFFREWLRREADDAGAKTGAAPRGVSRGAA